MLIKFQIVMLVCFFMLQKPYSISIKALFTVRRTNAMFWISLVLLIVPLNCAPICDQPVGFEDRRIPDANLTESSAYSRFQTAIQGRLNNVKTSTHESAWCAKKDDKNKYIQVDLGTVRYIAYVLLQGRNASSGQYTTLFNVSTSRYGTYYKYITNPLKVDSPMSFQGSKDNNAVVKVDIARGLPIAARFVRIHIAEFYGNPCLRMELLECHDIDECSESSSQCDLTSSECSNTLGGYTCQCKLGYKPSQVSNYTCDDIDECNTIQHNCNHTCDNFGGGYKCSCNPGYELQPDGKTCLDIEECLTNRSMCDLHNSDCSNTIGGYECICKPGYKKSIFSQYRCEDIDECTTTQHNCSQRCNNFGGSYKCSCKGGYTLQPDGKSCLDVDECSQGKDKCNVTTTTCSNNQGGYDCPCKTGYKRKDALNCVDINECINGDSKCSLKSTRCMNTVGSFYCECKPGYWRNATDEITMPYRCFDYNECAVNNGNCSHGCINLNGTYMCNCPEGYEIKSDNKLQCQDKNECLVSKGGCEQYCDNSIGSYSCRCKTGFKVVQKYKCEDINECAESKSDCDLATTHCSNYPGTFQCTCKPGHLPISGVNNKCKPLTCSALSPSSGTILSPSRCTQDGASQLYDVCTYSCQLGFEKPLGSGTTMTCQTSGTWQGNAKSCVRKTCPALTVPSNGKIWPDFCQVRGNSYEGKCYYQCNNNYNALGENTRVCQADGTWNTPVNPFKCVQNQPKPTISCPLPVTVKLQTGASTADISALLDKPQSNTATVLVSPAKYQTSTVFPAGRTVLTYTAVSASNETASCQTTISVIDEEKPRFSGCPSDIYDSIIGSSKVITWTPPVSTDNVGVVKVTSTSKPGDTFKIGPLVVYYHAYDAAGNIAACSFEVILRKKECAAPRTPDNGQIYVSEFNGIKFATIACNSGKQMFWNTWGVQCSSQTLEWDPIPDCVDGVALPSSGQCPAGFVSQQGGYNMCVKCPRGYFYDSVKKSCTHCAVNYYSGNEGSLSCTACPSNTGTLTTGSKQCVAKCPPGHESPDGYKGCKLCKQNFYEDRYGSTACKPCPDGMFTLTNGSKSLDACGGRPTITEFFIKPKNVSEGDPTEIVCKGTGAPLPTFVITKEKPAPDGAGGPVTVTSITDSLGRTIGIRHYISKTTNHDHGAYKCKLQNKFGITESYKALYVHLNIVGGRRRR